AGWLASPPQAFALEIEALLRIYLAPFGTRDDLLNVLESVRDEAETMLHIAAAFRASYLDSTSPAMDQLHVRAVLNDFLANFPPLALEWSERSIATVEAWRNLEPRGKRRAALRTFAELPPR